MSLFFNKFPDQFSWHKNSLIKAKRELSLIIADKSAVIPKTYNGLDVTIYKGYISRKISVNKLIIGYKFGEFAFTKKPFKFPIKNKKKKNFIRR